MWEAFKLFDILAHTLRRRMKNNDFSQKMLGLSSLDIKNEEKLK